MAALLVAFNYASAMHYGVGSVRVCSALARFQHVARRRRPQPGKNRRAKGRTRPHTATSDWKPPRVP